MREGGLEEDDADDRDSMMAICRWSWFADRDDKDLPMI